jgi:hypothetical protein
MLYITHTHMHVHTHTQYVLGVITFLQRMYCVLQVKVGIQKFFAVVVRTSFIAEKCGCKVCLIWWNTRHACLLILQILPICSACKQNSSKFWLAFQQPHMPLCGWCMPQPLCTSVARYLDVCTITSHTGRLVMKNLWHGQHVHLTEIW